MTSYDYLIVGGGMTADAAAHGIREVDQSGTIGIIAAESHAPYNRPPLSKGLWKEAGEDALWRGTESTNATVHLGRSAVKLDATSQDGDRRRGRGVPLRQAPAGDRRDAAPPRRCPRWRDLLPHARRLSHHAPSGRGREALHRDRRRLHRIGSRGGGADGRVHGEHGRSRGGNRCARLPGRPRPLRRALLSRQGSHRPPQRQRDAHRHGRARRLRRRGEDGRPAHRRCGDRRTGDRA